MNKNQWIKQVLMEIRFPFDRKEIKRELAEHIEDRTADYMDNGLAEEEAEAKAVADMGDAKAIGRELNKQHKPWIGMVWLGTNVIAAVAVFLLAVTLILGAIKGDINSLKEDKRVVDIEEFYQEKMMSYELENDFQEILYNWKTDYTIELEDMEICFRNFIFDDYEDGLEVFFSTKGKYSFKDSVLNVNFNGEAASCAGSFTGVDREGYRVGLHQATISNFEKTTKKLEVSYDKFGYSFEFTVDLTKGKIQPLNKTTAAGGEQDEV